MAAYQTLTESMLKGSDSWWTSLLFKKLKINQEDSMNVDWIKRFCCHPWVFEQQANLLFGVNAKLYRSTHHPQF
jgi:hypothetical protein